MIDKKEIETDHLFANVRIALKETEYFESFKAVIAGGFLYNRMVSEPLRNPDTDLDIYLFFGQRLSKSVMSEIQDTIYLCLNKHFNQPNTPRQFEYKITVTSQNYKVLKDYIYGLVTIYSPNDGKKLVQIILTLLNNSDELVETFDFSHCKISYDINTQEFISSMMDIKCMKEGLLRVNNKDQLTYDRLKKFIEKGYTLDLNDPNCMPISYPLLNKMQKEINDSI